MGKHTWGGHNLVADFSDFTKPRHYRVRIDNKTLEVIRNCREAVAIRAS